MKKRIRVIFYVIISLGLFWTLLTFWVEKAGKQQIKHVIAENENATALILYNPDPIYNLDEQVCMAFAKGLQKIGVSSELVTNKKVAEINKSRFDLYVVCANTYNFAPDKGLLKTIDKLKYLDGQPVVAITLGSGSTDRSKRKLEEFLVDKKLEIIQSNTLWLLRPNDESRMKESNTKVATDMAMNFASSLTNKPFLQKQ